VIDGFAEFEFDLPEALLASIIVAFDNMQGASLSQAHVSKIPEAQGVYQLILNGQIVYIGKTDSAAGLLQRLTRHAWTIQHRTNLNVAEVSFKAIRVFVFTAMDLETQLIKHYKEHSSVSWNNSGFGSNDPGRNRDKTRAKATSFDVLYPIDLDEKVKLEISGSMPVATALQTLRQALPYTLRVEGSGVHPDFDGLTITISENSITVREVLETIVARLPEGWQATALAGRIILYKECVDDYPAGRIIARS
jgi:hypothetical protein